MFSHSEWLSILSENLRKLHISNLPYLYISLFYCVYGYAYLSTHRGKRTKQLDIVVSPPAFLWDPYLTSTNVMFDRDI